VQLRETRITEQASFARVNEQQAEKYLRASLRVAVKTLDTAYDALQEVKSNGGVPNAAEVEKTIGMLSDTKLWDELLQTHGIAEDSTARGAVRHLAERIEKMSAGEVRPDSLQALLKDIDLLRQVIVLTLRQKGMLLSPSVVRECLSATSSIGMEVAVGLIAMLASSEAAGARPARIAVVCAAIGIGAGSTAKQVWNRLTCTARAHTIEAQLQQHHHDLLDTIGDLVIFLGGLIGDGPPTEKQRTLVLNVNLAAKLQANHLEQLAASTSLPQREEYCSELAQVKERLDEISRVVTAEDRQAANADIQKIRGARASIELFTRGIDELRPMWLLDP
jgi:hypothetical protein